MRVYEGNLEKVREIRTRTYW